MLNSAPAIYCFFAALLVLSISACSEKPHAAPGAQVDPQNNKDRLPPGQEKRNSAIADRDDKGPIHREFAAPKELSVEQLSGGWRIAKILRYGEPQIAGSAAAMKGAIAEIYPESIRWSYKPSGAKGLDDFCREPVAGIILQQAAAKKILKDFQIAFEHLQMDPAEAGPPHEWLCGSGKFGPSQEAGADFVIIEDKAMLLRWSGGRLFYLQKLERPAPKADMQPPDYAADR